VLADDQRGGRRCLNGFARSPQTRRAGVSGKSGFEIERDNAQSDGTLTPCQAIDIAAHTALRTGSRAHIAHILSTGPIAYSIDKTPAPQVHSGGGILTRHQRPRTASSRYACCPSAQE